MAEFLTQAYFEEWQFCDDWKSKMFAMVGRLIFLQWWDIFKTRDQYWGNFRKNDKYINDYLLDLFNQLAFLV